MKIAARLGMTVDEAQQKITASGFVDWCTFFDMEWEEREKQEYYMARLIAEVRRFAEAFSKSPRKISDKDFLIEWNLEGQAKTLKSGSRAVLTKEQEESDTPPEGWVRPGKDLMKDPKWAMVNMKAKASWAAFVNKKDSNNGQ